MLSKICIIGANSYIAKNLIYTLLNKDGIELSLFDIGEKCFFEGVNYKQLDMLDKVQVEKIPKDFDIIYFFTGQTGTDIAFDEVDNFIDRNEKSLLNILNKLKKDKSKSCLIFPSTRLVYKGKPGALKETDDKDFNSIYAINKFSCEKYLELYNKAFDIQYLIVRICIPYGNLVDGDISYGTIGFFLNSAKNNKVITIYGDGQQKRSLIHVEDLALKLYQISQKRDAWNNVYNLGGPDIFSLKEIAEIISKRFNADVQKIKWPELSQKLESGDTYFDDSKISKCIGADYMHSFEDWIEKVEEE